MSGVAALLPTGCGQWKAWSSNHLLRLKSLCINGSAVVRCFGKIVGAGMGRGITERTLEFAVVDLSPPEGCLALRRRCCRNRYCGYCTVRLGLQGSAIDAAVGWRMALDDRFRARRHHLPGWSR